METLANLPILLFESLQGWEQWLDEHHTQAQGVWLKIAKKGTEGLSVSYANALAGALCYGWIDGQKNSYDDTFWLQKFTRRRPKSVWSKVNTEKVTQLIESGKMKPARCATLARSACYHICPHFVMESMQQQKRDLGVPLWMRSIV